LERAHWAEYNPAHKIEPSDSPATEPASPNEPAAGWSVRPVWRPWWRRRGPRTVLLAGAAAVLLIAGTAVWLVAQAPAAPRDHSGDLRQYLLPAPPGSTVSVPDGLVSAASIDDSLFAAATVQQAGVRQVAVEAWLEPVGQNRVRVGLVRFESDDQASQVLSGFLLMKGGRPVNRGSGTYRERPVPPPSTTVPRPLAIGERGDVLFMVAYTGPGASVPAIHALARNQYDLL
jgi:hypothetical protein